MKPHSIVCSIEKEEMGDVGIPPKQKGKEGVCNAFQLCLVLVHKDGIV